MLNLKNAKSIRFLKSSRVFVYAEMKAPRKTMLKKVWGEKNFREIMESTQKIMYNLECICESVYVWRKILANVESG
jgi:hypothetical protein